MILRRGALAIVGCLLAGAETASAVDRPIAGTKLVLARRGTRGKLLFVSKDPTFLFPAVGGPDDPASGSPGGMQIDLFSRNEGAATLGISPGAGKPGWKVVAPDRYRFGNPDAPAGISAVRTAVLKAPGYLKVSARDTGLALTGSQGAVGIRIVTGTLRNCALFDTPSIRKDEAGAFTALGAVASALADCSDAALGASTTTSTTTSSTTSTTTISSPITRLEAVPSAAVAEVITSADGSLAPGGAPMRNEVWMGVVVTTAVYPGFGEVHPGDPSPFVTWTLQSGATGCLEQYDGTGTSDADWRPFDTVGAAASGLGADTPARFRATAVVPAGGCTVVLRPVCTGGSCNPGVTHGDVTFTVQHGFVRDFFIESPGRTCVDGEPADFTFARYAIGGTGTAPGMAADFFVCARPSFGPWLRYDVLTGDGSDNPDISWSVSPSPIPPAEPLFVDGDAPGDLSADGYVRYNTSVAATGTSATLTATHAARSDSITLLTDTDGADELSVISPNTGTSAPAACTSLPATPPGAGTIESCLIAEQAEQIRILASGPGIGVPIDVSSDHAIQLAIAPGAASCGVTLAGARERIVTAGSPGSPPAGYCGTTLRASVDTAILPGVTVPPLDWDLAVLTGPYSSFNTSTPYISLFGVGDVGTIDASLLAATTFGPVRVDWSRWSIGHDPAQPGLVSYQPFAVAPFTSRYWTVGFVPLGIAAGGADQVRPGMPDYARIYAAPLPSGGTATIDVGIPGYAGFQIGVIANP